MDRTRLLTFLLVISLAACRGKNEEMKRGQQQYDVVQEGSASGVSSTINPLNEPVRPAAPLTNTAVDTTTNFTLPNTMPAATATTGGTIASTLPPPVYVPPPSRPTPRPRPAERTPEPAMASTSNPPAQTDTSTPPPAATNTATDPAEHVEGENKEKSEEKKSEPPPPPPPTDTIGG